MKNECALCAEDKVRTEKKVIAVTAEHGAYYACPECDKHLRHQMQPS